MIDFDDIWQKYSKYCRIEFACFSFYVAFLSTVRSFTLDAENNTNFDAVSSQRANFDEVQFFLQNIIFGTRNLQIFKHNTLINELLLMQFYVSHSSELSQFHQQPVDSNQRLCHKLPSSVTFTFIQTCDRTFVLFTEWRHVDRECDA